MKKITIIISSIVLLFLILFFVVPKYSFSELENRALSSFPKISLENIKSGKYMSDIETYISDHYPFKNKFLFLKTFIYKIIGFNEIDNVYFAKEDFLIEDYPNISYKDDIIKVINNLDSKVNSNVELMIVPTKIMIYSNYLPKYAKYNNQISDINYIYKKLNIKTINVFPYLNENKNKYQLFYKTDHHWTSIGAYFGYKAYMDKINKKCIDLLELNQKEVTSEFLGSNYSRTTNYNQEKDKIYIFDIKNNLEIKYADNQKETNTLYNFDYLNKKDKYSIFLDNNHSLINIINKDVKSGNLLIIKDSFANSMIPLLVNHYHKIDIIDPRYYKRSISKYINENNIEEVLIIYNYGTLAKDKNIMSIR